jgi:ABC-type nitrate/sulfonate/bicarbonate transport system permease component
MTVRFGNHYIKVFLKGAAFPLLLIVIWEIAARTGHGNALFLPAPSKIGHTFLVMAGDGLWAKNLIAISSVGLMVL